MEEKNNVSFKTNNSNNNVNSNEVLTEPKFYLECMEDIRDENVSFMWEPYIPMGKFVLLAGDPGVGKTYVTTYIASVISNGGKFPFCENNTEQGNVIIINGEDSAGGELKKRLKQADANLKNIFVVSNKQLQITLGDTNYIEEFIEDKKPQLIIVDPLNSFIGNVDTHKDSAFRSAMAPIVNLCDKYNVTLLCVSHLNKSGGDKSYYRVNGSIAYIGMPRSVLYLVNSFVKENEKVLSQQKNSYGEKGKPLSFSITDNGIEWKEQLDDFNIEEFTSSEAFSMSQVASNFILETLKNGETEAKELSKLAKGYDIKDRTFQRARSELKKANMIDCRQENHITYWFLKPQKVMDNSEVTSIQKETQEEKNRYKKIDEELKITTKIDKVRDLASY